MPLGLFLFTNELLKRHRKISSVIGKRLPQMGLLLPNVGWAKRVIPKTKLSSSYSQLYSAHFIVSHTNLTYYPSCLILSILFFFIFLLPFLHILVRSLLYSHQYSLSHILSPFSLPHSLSDIVSSTSLMMRLTLGPFEELVLPLGVKVQVTPYL